MFWILVASIAGGVVGLVVAIYALYKGHFEDQEEVKYQVFHDEE